MENTTYRPGYYGKKRQSVAEWVELNIKKYGADALENEEEKAKPAIHPTICISRKIGSGALEIADYLGAIIKYRVIDRELLEHMAKDAHLSEKIVGLYDERYPGRTGELFSMLISEKTFIKSDYARQLVKTVTALAGSEPTIFVGRGTHLILPKKDVLSVRIIGSREFRVERITAIRNLKKTEAQKQLDIWDAEQAEFFKAVYGKKETTPDEFELVINMDHVRGVFQAAKIIECAFKLKFGEEKFETFTIRS
ncbi:MAG: cytidylate kinase-like family protein, partial [Desulfobacula sp.]|jgi:cytidylate kinase